jgi:hypothetical protein
VGAALASGHPRGAAALFLGAAAAAFLAHEPLCVAAGLRGQRARRTAGARAARWLWRLVPVFVACATAGACLAPGIALLAGAPGAVGLGLVPLALRRLERSTAGEAVAATALSGAALPVAVASGVPVGPALAAWMAWTAGFGSLTLAVRQTTARARGSRPVPAGLAVGGPALVVASGWLLSRQPTLLGALPLLACAAVLFRWPPSPRHLRAVGWSLAAATLVSAALIAWTSPP